VSNRTDVLEEVEKQARELNDSLVDDVALTSVASKSGMVD